MRFLNNAKRLPLLIVLLGLGLASACAPLAAAERSAESPLPPERPLSFQTRPAEDSVRPPLAADLAADLAAELAELSVEKAVLLALRNNGDLQVRQQTPVIVGAFEQIERGVFDPELFAETEYFRERTSETSRSTGEEFEVTGDDLTAVAGLRQRLPTGTTLETSLSQQRTTSSRTPEQQTARLGLSVTQSLLRGFGPAVNLATVRQAELDTLASIDELRGFSEALLADSEIAYWNYVLAKEEIAIFEASLEVARKQREEVELRIEVGILPEIEAAAARAEEALRVQLLINARSLLEERRLRLLRLISPSADGHLDRQLTAISDPRLPPQPISDLDDRLQLAEQSRPDLNEARRRLQQSRLETVVTRNGLLPRLDFFVALGKSGFADSFAESFRRLDGDSYDLSAGLRLNYLLGNRPARAQNLAAHAGRQQASAALANLRQLVHLDVRLAVNEVERTRRQIDASRATRIFREQTLAAEQERFEVGTSTALLVAQAQRDLLETRIAESQAIVDYRIALVGLYRAEGSLLDRRGVAIVAAPAPAALR
jgi:outer membrane protein TolC